jgi:hypothetical protein
MGHGPLKKMLYFGFVSAIWAEMEVVDKIHERSEDYPNQKSMECDSQETYRHHLE